MNRSKILGVALATAAAGFFSLATVTPAFADEAGTVKCDSSSACKGHGACKQASNACKGQNGCKGQGFTMQQSAEDCTAAQATVKG
ncbi:MAG: hypothetical protein EXR86_09130 [Gammaproteobacteria bacterium]|nr:hypothetical protein [Gammaproteobacteria bacterium]